MYKIEKGILCRDNRKVFAVGQSYYPSFHHAKYPVPPEGDRIGEMKKDLRLMHEMGFNHVRFAAIGLTKLGENGNLVVDTPFVDAMIEEAAKNDISVSVRLEGYVVNLHDFRDVLMVDHEGIEQDTGIWYDFIQTTLHHEGLKEDNRIQAAGLAKHYAAYENVVALQIYNEPHYPGNTFFDYHPLTIEAYRKWLVEKGVMTKEQAADYQPPRSRKEQSPQMWALWRLFSRDSLTEFLANSSRAAREASGLPTYTCYTACQASMVNAYRGVDYFGGARDMDIAGYTCYLNGEGSDYYMMCILLDMNVSAAKLQGKESWCVELDSRTTIPPRIFNKNTYAVVGSGAKGILYYQWRGDYPSEATPIPNGCGLVNYDGSKTPNYENAANMVALLNELSGYIADSNPVSYGIGILHSDYAVFTCDAMENDGQMRTEITQNSCMAALFQIYRDIRRAGLAATFITPEQLAENPTGLKILFVPKADALSEPEKQAVEAFVSQGGKAYQMNTRFNDFTTGTGYGTYGKPFGLYQPYMEFADLADVSGWKAFAESSLFNVALQILEGEDYKLIVMTNTSCQEKPVSPVITCHFPFREAFLYTSHGEPKEVRTAGNRIYVEDITDGGMILVR